MVQAGFKQKDRKIAMFSIFQQIVHFFNKMTKC